MTKVAAVLSTLAVAAMGHAETMAFDGDPPGGPPAGWTCGSTGGGAPRWLVEADAAAPSRPQVLKQSGKAPFRVARQ